jgi:hypothetical protein
MTEISQVVIQFIVFLFLSFFPINKIITPNIFNKLEKSIFNCFFVNIIFFLFLLLLLSFTEIPLNLIFNLVIIFYSFLFLINSSKIIYDLLNIKNLTLIIFFFIINIFLFIKIANNFEIGWDGLSIWLFKANNFYNNHNYFNLANVEGMQNYPHFGGYLWAFFWKNTFLEKEYLGRLFYMYLYILSLFIIIDSVKNISNIKKIFFLYLLFIFSFDFSLMGYQEYIIFALLVFSAKQLFLIINKKNNSKIIYISLIANLVVLSWIKNECIFYVIFISIIFVTLTSDNKRKILLSVIILFSIFIQIYLMKYVMHANTLGQLDMSTRFIESFFDGNLLKKFYYITVFLFFHSSLKYFICLINLFSIILLIFLKKNIKENRFIYFFLLLNLLFIYSIYILDPYSSLIWHLQTSVKRLMLQTSGFYIFIIINLLNKKIIKF